MNSKIKKVFQCSDGSVHEVQSLAETRQFEIDRELKFVGQRVVAVHKNSNNYTVELENGINLVFESNSEYHGVNFIVD